MNKYILLAGVVFALIVSLVVSVHIYSPKSQQAYTGPSPTSTSSIAANVTPTKASSSSSAGKTQVVKTSELASGFDLSDDRKLMGASHNVFVGKVVKAFEVSQETPTPPRFAVNVMFNIKGNLQGTVTVSQLGEYKNGVLWIMKDGDIGVAGAGYLLQPGSTYLLATRWNPGDVYGVLGAGKSVELISEDNTLSNAQLQALAMNDYRVIQLEQAYPNEIPFPPDVFHNNDRNSYQSLSPEQKAALPQPPPPAPPPHRTPTLAPTSTISVSSSVSSTGN